jgi:hypothetical protein
LDQERAALPAGGGGPPADVIDGEVVGGPTPAAIGGDLGGRVLEPTKGLDMSDIEQVWGAPPEQLVGSGWTIKPALGLRFAGAVSSALGVIATLCDQSVAALTATNVNPTQRAKMTELAKLVRASKSHADTMVKHFKDHMESAAHVDQTGAGTRGDYLMF